MKEPLSELGAKRQMSKGHSLVAHRGISVTESVVPQSAGSVSSVPTASVGHDLGWQEEPGGIRTLYTRAPTLVLPHSPWPQFLNLPPEHDSACPWGVAVKGLWTPMPTLPWRQRPWWRGAVEQRWSMCEFEAQPGLPWLLTSSGLPPLPQPVPPADMEVTSVPCHC